MSDTTEPAWLVEGGPCFVERVGGPVTQHRITRLTKTQVVLTDGQRFNRARLSRSGSQWSGTLYLRGPKDPAALKKLASQRYRSKVSSTRAKVDALMLAWTRAPEGDLSSAHAAVVLLRDATAELEGDS